MAHLTLEQRYNIETYQQLLRSGTNPGAMLREAEHSQSKANFIYKLSIAQKEINETIYWLELLSATDYLTQKKFEIINNDAIEIIKLITSIIKTTKANISKTNY